MDKFEDSLIRCIRKMCTSFIPVIWDEERDKFLLVEMNKGIND